MMLAMLATSTLRVSVVLLLAIAAAAVLRRHSAAVRSHLMATGVCGALLIPLLAGLLPAWHVALMPQVARPAAGGRSETPLGVTLETERVPPPAPPRTAAVAVPHETARRAGTLALAIWLAGVLAGVLGLGIGLLRLARISRRATPLDEGLWFDNLQAIAACDPLLRRTIVLQSAGPTLLVTWGWLRPRIIVPAVATTWSAERVRIVLEHEAEHIRRRDWPLQLTGEIVRTLHWFNPLAWLATSRLRLESERACDDAVIARGVAAADYAEQLVAVARTLSNGRTWVPAPAIARPSSLERRVSAMLDQHTTRRPVSRAARLAIVAVGLALTASIATFAAQSSFATVSGTIHDQLGGTLPGVIVTLTDAQSGAKHEIRTDERGTFELVGLVPGNYTFEVWSAGFKPLENALQLAEGQKLHRNLTLEIGELQETIRVADGPSAAAAPSGGTPPTAAAATCSAPPNSGQIVPPRKVRNVRPQYPSSMQDTGAEGLVSLRARIGLDGAIRDVQTIEATNPQFELAAVEAVRQWRFTQTLLNCVPVEVDMNVIASFGANGSTRMQLGAAALPPPPPPPPPAPPHVP